MVMPAILACGHERSERIQIGIAIGESYDMQRQGVDGRFAV